MKNSGGVLLAKGLLQGAVKFSEGRTVLENFSKVTRVP